MYNVLTAV